MIDQTRAAAVILGKPVLRDRNEEEVAGYRSALKLIHEKNIKLEFSEENILHFHRLTKGETGDAGKYKVKDGDIIEILPDGNSRIRFSTVPAKDTPRSMFQLTAIWNELIQKNEIPAPVLLAASNLDFLCIHPFRDGNGRVSRLLLLLQSYYCGFEVGRYISFERLIELNKERYYETLEISSQGWHKGRHDPWPYIQFILYILRSTYKELEEKLGQMVLPRGEKQDMIRYFIAAASEPFTIRDIQNSFPNVSIDMIRHVLKIMH